MLKRRKKFSIYTGTTHEIEPIVRLWIMRMLVPLGALREFIGSNGFENDGIAEAIGLKIWIDPYPRDFDEQVVRTELRELYSKNHAKWRKAVIPANLACNIEKIAQLVGLSEVDKRILEFAVITHTERLLDDAADWLGALPSSKVPHVLGIILDIPEEEVRAALKTSEILAQSGLVTLDEGSNALGRKLTLLSDSFADLMSSDVGDPITLLRGTISQAIPPSLTLAHFDHIQPSLEILLPYLEHVLQTAQLGVNIFIHGSPGTGKSELSRVVAQHLGCELFEVASEDEDGDPLKGERRLRAFRAAQSFLGRKQAIIAFDEAEDVFCSPNSFFGTPSLAQERKAWMNRMLEGNATPTFWISNSIRGLDPAFMRRFDMVFDLPIPPKKQRQRLLEESCADLLEPEHMARIAEVPALAPAVVARSSQVIHAIKDKLGKTKSLEAFDRLISNTLSAQGHRPLIQHDPNRLPETYDPQFIQADANLEQIAQGLQDSQSGRLCLYGPPGTGKTAYARWLAKKLDMPLHIKRASDLMSKWLGENEQNVAAAFTQAQAAKAILLIDEVDSFLQDRRSAERSYESRLVNEMLTQMESYSGIFIASTNLMTNLDQAALRRFDLKVKFDFLRPEQAQALLIKHCEKLELPEPKPTDLAQIARLSNLTPGDFAAVVRQSRFRRLLDAEGIVAALFVDCGLKETKAHTLGFI